MEDKIIYRWYAFVSGGWLATCWRKPTEKEANDLQNLGLFKSEFKKKEIKLVCEKTTYTDTEG